MEDLPLRHITAGTARYRGRRSDRLSIDDFIISFFVAGPNSTTLPLYIYAMVKRGISPEINALSTLLMFATITLVVIAQILQPQHTSDKNSD